MSDLLTSEELLDASVRFTVLETEFGTTPRPDTSATATLPGLLADPNPSTADGKPRFFAAAIMCAIIIGEFGKHCRA